MKEKEEVVKKEDIKDDSSLTSRSIVAGIINIPLSLISVGIASESVDRDRMIDSNFSYGNLCERKKQVPLVSMIFQVGEKVVQIWDEPPMAVRIDVCILCAAIILKLILENNHEDDDDINK